MCGQVIKLLFTIYSLFFLASCATITDAGTHIVTENMLPALTDDLSFSGLVPALDRQLQAFKNEPYKRKIRLGSDVYPFTKLVESVREFRSLVITASNCIRHSTSTTHTHNCEKKFDNDVKSKFRFYKAEAYSDNGSSYFTAYYTPVIEVSEKQDHDHPYPIYKTPTTYLKRLTRREIDFEGKLKGKGYEIFFAKDLFDIYILHVEGGGKVQVKGKNGRQYSTYLSYQSDNGRQFTHIDEYMLQNGMLKSQRRSRLDQREYFKKNPDKIQDIFSSCEGYVFFKITNTPPIGSTGAQLTPNRSIATDPSYYPAKGLITYLTASIPVFPNDNEPLNANRRTYRKHLMHRFFIDQDIGHSITGPARADIYFGEGENATFQANNLSTYGTMYILILK